MKGESHKLLGRYLIQQYMEQAPRRYSKAFLIGCIEPDRNPVTYLKGSIRSQFLRGHNWGNSQRYMFRLGRRLENRRRLHLLDFYALGKLIHYTTDAFTYAHNEEFEKNLKQHNAYELDLQNYFLDLRTGGLDANYAPGTSVTETIQKYHQDYSQAPMNRNTDIRFAVSVCSAVFHKLLSRHGQSILAFC